MKEQKDITANDEPPRLVGIQYATGEEQRNSSRKNEEAGPKQQWWSVVDVSDGESKVWCCKEQYCIETWNHESRKIGCGQARKNTDILGIGELKWMGMGELNSDDHYIYYRGQESIRRNGVAFTVNKRV